MKTIAGKNQSERDEVLLDRIVRTIANEKQCDPLDLSPLYESVDPDALQQVAQGDGVTEIAFWFDDYRVRITGAGDVQVTSG